MLCQRVKKELFETEAEYLAALAAHHAVLAAAVKTKQVVDVTACDALDTLVWGAPLGGAASQKPVGRAKNRLVVLIETVSHDRGVRRKGTAQRLRRLSVTWMGRFADGALNKLG